MQAPHSLDALASMDALRDALRQRGMVPGWEKLPKPIFTKEMHSEFDPGHWRYRDVRAAMESAGRLVSTELAERRNTIMVNPRPGHDIETLNTLICAYQSILPGETARSHRHTSHAMRVILESRGSYSIVNGHRHPMETGDIILTPGGCWHGHGHDGDAQAFWFDCLDIPLTRRLETVFFEDHPDHFEAVTDNAPESPFRYTWSSTQAKLQGAPEGPHWGHSIELEALHMPTITIKVHRMDRNWVGQPYRHSANMIHVVLQGHGQTSVDDRVIDWEFGDTVALPAWRRLAHQASSDAVVVSLSDENLQRWSRFYRFQSLVQC